MSRYDSRMVVPRMHGHKNLYFKLPIDAWSVLRSIIYHAVTVYLFVRSDIKTIIIPTTSFAFIVVDASWNRGFFVPLWVFGHLLLFDIDNQALSFQEDIVNKPWRPVSSGRISVETALLVGRSLFPLCMGVSLLTGGFDLLWSSVAFCGLTFAYNHLLLSQNWLWKNIITTGLYLASELGATTVLGGGLPRNINPIMALALSGLVIITTVHISDLQDEEGDRKAGRKTAVIYLGQNVTQASIIFFVMLWSTILPLVWGLPVVLQATYMSLGLLIASRTFRYKNKLGDEKTYRIYNFWLVAIHLLAAAPKLGAAPLFSSALPSGLSI